MLKKKDDRQKAASFIKEESHKLGNMFQRLSHATNPKVNIMYYITYKLLFITPVYTSIGRSSQLTTFNS